MEFAKFLDKHLLLSVLDELSAFYKQDLKQMKLNILSETLLFDQLIQAFKDINNKEPESEQFDNLKHRKTYEEQQENYQKDAQPLLDFLNQEDQVEEIKQQGKFTKEDLVRSHHIRPTCFDSLLSLAKLSFEMGQYQKASDLLYWCRKLRDDDSSILWSKISSEILTKNQQFYRYAWEDLKYIADNSEKTSLNKIWLLHWVLVFVFKHYQRFDLLVDLCCNEKFSGFLQSNLSYLQPYFIFAFILSGKWVNVKDYSNYLTQQLYHQDHPSYQFIHLVFNQFQYEAALKEVQKFESINDWLLNPFKQQIQQESQQLLLFIFLQTHKNATYKEIQAQTGVQNVEEVLIQLAQKLAKHQNLSLKIDAVNESVQFFKTHNDVYQTIVDKTKGVTYRSSIMQHKINPSKE